MEEILIIAVNPGSTSTKVAVYRNEDCIFEKNISHSNKDLAPFKNITDQFSFRKNVINEEIKALDLDLAKVRAVVGRGGLVKPIPSGTYTVNEKMMHDLRHSPRGEHASNLGGLIAHEIASGLPNAKAYIADPVVVDEMEEVARISGHPLFRRESIFHALNQKATAKRHARKVGKAYEELRLIVVHMGGGISVGAHRNGRVVDVNQAIGGEGAFSPQRSGTLPSIDLVDLCFSGDYSREEVNKMLIGEGGLSAYLGTNSAIEVEKRIREGDKKAELIYSAMAYQVAKMVGEMYTVLECEVDCILITGGIAYDKWFVGKLESRIRKIAPIAIYPGENEMESLAMNGLNVVSGIVEPQIYA
jgi:butyrate kinase